jgi:hypothetical protein
VPWALAKKGSMPAASKALASSTRRGVLMEFMELVSWWFYRLVALRGGNMKNQVE